jgi:hypothetical protein
MIVAEEEEGSGQRQNTSAAGAGVAIGGGQFTESEQRMNALYTAQSTFGGHPTTAEELVKRAEIIRKYIHDGVSA